MEIMSPTTWTMWMAREERTCEKGVMKAIRTRMKMRSRVMMTMKMKAVIN